MLEMGGLLSMVSKSTLHILHVYDDGDTCATCGVVIGDANGGGGRSIGGGSTGQGLLSGPRDGTIEGGIGGGGTEAGRLVTQAGAVGGAITGAAGGAEI